MSSDFDPERLARRGLAGVLDPYDTVGSKNLLIDRAHKYGLRRHAGELRGKRVLEIGCGNGRISSWLVARGATVWGVDASPGMIEAAREFVPGARFDIARVGDDSFDVVDGRFDLVVSVYVLAHIPIAKLENAMTGVRERLVDGGAFLAVEKIGTGEIDAGWTEAQYRAAFASGGFRSVAAWPVRLGQSRLLEWGVRHPRLARAPFMAFGLNQEARREVSQGRSGSYVDHAFLASVNAG